MLRSVRSTDSEPRVCNQLMKLPDVRNGCREAREYFLHFRSYNKEGRRDWWVILGFRGQNISSGPQTMLTADQRHVVEQSGNIRNLDLSLFISVFL